MATEDRRVADSVGQGTGPVGPGLVFEQAVRLLLRLEATPVVPGSARYPGQEQIRFRSRTSLAFPASDIHSLEIGEDGRQHRLEVNFLGLASPTTRTSLPVWYAEELLRQAKDLTDAPRLRDFLDLFNHRLISLFFRAWAKHDLPFQHEFLPHGVLHDLLHSIVGLTPKSARRRLAVDDRFLLRHAGTLAQRPVTAEALLEMARDYLRDPIELEQFVARREPLNPEDQLRLGDPRFALGQNTALGSSVRVCRSGIRFRIGPLRWERFREYLPPTGSRACSLAALTEFAIGLEFHVDACLVLDKRDVPKAQLGNDSSGIALGRSIWLGTRLPSRPGEIGTTVPDADDTVIPLSRDQQR